MGIYRKYLVLILFIVGVFILSLTRAEAAPRHRRRLQKKAKIRSEKKNYNYIKNHDYNNDGKVDVKDRLMWANKHKNSAEVTYVSKENEDLVEMMDADGDGGVDYTEMTEFYKQYDTNNNGVLEDDEINRAAE
jgi:hypothetical protein